jgi:hypothetical protein
MESPDFQALIRQSTELGSRSAQLCERAGEVIAEARQLAAQKAVLHDAIARTRADRYRLSLTELRRAAIGPGLWPGPRGQARWAGGGLRRSKAGPDDRFCGPVRKDLRVPWTPERSARTLRGVPPRCLWHHHDDWRT